ncbi:MAG: hypothetical protein IKR22_01845 [Clostridiales bacterium]|nr:hypothetical protein [Clostridiales bacterium]
MNYNFDWDIVSEGAPYVTISKLGVAFNMAAIKKLGTPAFVMLGLDSEKMVLGVKTAPEWCENDKNTYQFRERIKNGWVRIGCKEFVRYLEKLSGMDYSRARRYIADFDSENQLLIVKVNGEGDEESNEE